ncbi:MULTISPECIES: sensor histidine kinase [Actinomadura]|uniref:sensor histidine kinase n=1 Tax=Actinomadura TaxID=1988 RepID=UPI000427C152|nr:MULTISPECIES: sensor histidine kinase [Actinomadura]RSN70308.1 sensor histidine kinase [Actinomadura sp. WAC 06369]
MSTAPVPALYWRILGINGLIFALGTATLALAPVTISSMVLLRELPVLLVGLSVMMLANALLLRASLAPLGRLTTLMARMDSLSSGDRLATKESGDLLHLVDEFNSMLDRLEVDRSTGTAMVLDAQEAERRRIAQELHDEIGQTLTVALLELKSVADRAPGEVAEELRGVLEVVRSSLDEVRHVARRLRPGVLDDLGLTSALIALPADFSGGPHVTRDVQTGLTGVGADVELVVYRIAQESLTNVWRHAGAEHAELCLRQEADGTLVLRVADDGCGPPERAGAGIRGMRERAMLVGAQLSIGPAAGGRGTEVRLVVPPKGTRRRQDPVRD